MLEAHGRGIEAQEQKRLALVSTLRRLDRDVEPLSVTFYNMPTLSVSWHESCAHQCTCAYSSYETSTFDRRCCCC